MPMRIGNKIFPTKQEAFKAKQKRLAYWWDEKSLPLVRESILIEAFGLPINVRGYCNPILVACLHCPWFELPYLIRKEIERHLRTSRPIIQGAGRSFKVVS